MARYVIFLISLPLLWTSDLHWIWAAVWQVVILYACLSESLLIIVATQVYLSVILWRDWLLMPDEQSPGLWFLVYLLVQLIIFIFIF